MISLAARWHIGTREYRFCRWIRCNDFGTRVAL